jgi:hypothetical protein
MLAWRAAEAPLARTRFAIVSVYFGARYVKLGGAHPLRLKSESKTFVSL